MLIKAAPLMFCSPLEGKPYLVHLSRGGPLRATACEKQYKHANCSLKQACRLGQTMCGCSVQ